MFLIGCWEHKPIGHDSCMCWKIKLLINSDLIQPLIHAKTPHFITDQTKGYNLQIMLPWTGASEFLLSDLESECKTPIFCIPKAGQSSGGFQLKTTGTERNMSIKPQTCKYCILVCKQTQQAFLESESMTVGRNWMCDVGGAHPAWFSLMA